jgi:hypothetical protein
MKYALNEFNHSHFSVDELRQKKVDYVSGILDIDKISSQALLDYLRWVCCVFIIIIIIIIVLKSNY